MRQDGAGFQALSQQPAERDLLAINATWPDVSYSLLYGITSHYIVTILEQINMLMMMLVVMMVVVVVANDGSADLEFHVDIISVLQVADSSIMDPNYLNLSTCSSTVPRQVIYLVSLFLCSRQTFVFSC